MKRSERFQVQARRAALHACLILSASVAGCVWSVALVEPLPSGGMLAGMIGAAGLYAACALANECARLRRLADKEARWEYEREIRPRI